MSESLEQDGPHLPEVYFDIARHDDGRFCVQLVRRNGATRKSYTPRVADVIGQMDRARLPVRTDDAELKRVCQELQLELLA